MRTTRRAIGISAPFGLAAIMIMVCFTSLVRAVDWSQYNGPLGDVSSPESIRTNWTAQPPKVLWRQSIGQGWSSISTGGGRLFTQARRQTADGPREFCVALDAVTGAELWARDLDVSDYTDISQTDRRADGPRSTPSVSGDFVYVYTSQLRLYCLAAADGSVVWSRDFREELGSQNIPWENAASPLLVGDLIYLNSNGGSRRLTAINKNDGKTVWSNLGDRLTHATPIYATLHGVPQVVFLTRSGLVSVLPDTGALLWRLEFSPSSTSTAASPSVSGDYVYASAAYGSGTWIGRVTKNGETFSASLVLQQQATEYQAHWATPVAKDGFFYAVPAPNSGQGRLACLEAATAVNRWTRSLVGSSEISYGSVIKAANTLIVLTESGELVLVEANPKAYTETARFKVLSAYCWNRPVLANGRIYVRNSAVNSEIVALDVSPPSVPVPPLTLSASIGTAGVLELLIQAVDGTPLGASHLDRLQLVSSIDVGTAREAWRAMEQPLTVTDRGIRAGVTLLPEQARFITVRVKP